MKFFRIAAILLILFSPALKFAQSQDRVALEEAIRLTDFGVEAALKGLWAEASFRWEQALEVYPNFPAAHNNLGVVSEHFGKYEKAKEHYLTAWKLSRENRHVDSNNRMFLQFYFQHIKTKDKLKTGRLTMSENEAGETNADVVEPDDPDAMPEQPDNQPSDDQTSEMSSQNMNSDASEEDLIIAGPLYHKMGAPRQVFIKHPKRQTILSEKYRKVYIAGFTPIEENSDNLNFETTEYLRSELRKFSLYEIIPLEELSLPKDVDEFYQLVDDIEFWRNLGNKVGADLIVYGMVNFYSEPSDGFLPYEYRDYRSGQYRTASMLIQRTAFSIELELYFHDAASGELIHEESFGQTIVYRGRLDLNLQSFYDVMNRVLPRFMDLMVPREHDAIRFIING